MFQPQMNNHNKPGFLGWSTSTPKVTVSDPKKNGTTYRMWNNIQLSTAFFFLVGLDQLSVCFFIGIFGVPRWLTRTSDQKPPVLAQVPRRLRLTFWKKCRKGWIQWLKNWVMPQRARTFADLGSGCIMPLGIHGREARWLFRGSLKYCRSCRWLQRIQEMNSNIPIFAQQIDALFAGLGCEVLGSPKREPAFIRFSKRFPMVSATRYRTNSWLLRRA